MTNREGKHSAIGAGIGVVAYFVAIAGFGFDWNTKTLPGAAFILVGALAGYLVAKLRPNSEA